MYAWHFKACPFYEAFKAEEKANGPIREDKQFCSWCDREKERRAEEAKNATPTETETNLTELNKFFN